MARTNRRSSINKAALAQRRQTSSRRGIKTATFNVFNNEAIIENDVAKSITSALWTNNVSKITRFYTGSAQSSSTAGQYQWDIYQYDPRYDASASVEFNIAWGHFKGSGSKTGSGASSQGLTPSKAVYTAFANMLLEAGDDQFTIDGVDTEPMYFISVQRKNFKQKMNPNGWMIQLKDSKILHLIDDSRYNAATSVNGNRVYNIISGTLADGQASTGTHKYGFFYPDLGILAISHTAMDAHPGGFTANVANIPGGGSYVGNLDKLYEWMDKAGARWFQGRAEEDISSTHYFVRVKNSEYNFSNNPTFVTGSGTLYNAGMVGDPKVYISTVGLYNEENELVATAKLSKPLQKSFSREATIRVKLDY